jgi:hypothetical protein
VATAGQGIDRYAYRQSPERVMRGRPTGRALRLGG